jgi:hypothetical protein
LGQGKGNPSGFLPVTRSMQNPLYFRKRESKSRPDLRIVTVFTRGINQDGVEVMSFERKMLIYKCGHSPEAAANY